MAITPPPTSSSPERPGEVTSDETDRIPAFQQPSEITDEQENALLEVLIAGRHMTRDEVGDLAAMQRALRSFQMKEGLEVTGQVDRASVQKAGDIIAWVAAINPSPSVAPDDQAAGGQVAAVRDNTNQFPGGQGPPAPSAPAGGSGAASPSTTGSGAGAGTGGGAPAPAAVSASTSTANVDGYHTIPGGAEIWQVDGTNWFAVYRVPGNSTPLAWRIEGDDLQAVFGPGVTPIPTRTLNGLQAYAEGPLVFGSSRMLANQSEHPFDAFVANFETEARVRPWLRDEEILGLTTRALLEGRTVTDAELAGTNWWRTHTAGERSWISEFNRDPATARQKVTDGRDTVRRLLMQSGVEDPPEVLVTWLGDRMTGGTWTQAYVFGQIAKVADPYAPGEIDAALAPLLADLPAMNTLSENVGKVDALLRQWVGPVVASGWTKEQKESWAGRLRNDPSAEEELIRVLQGNRQALFGGYDPSLSYDDIAAPWRGVASTVWGQQMDETDPLFVSIVQANDLAFAQQQLRKEGMRRGIGKVADDALGALGQSDLGVSVRRAA